MHFIVICVDQICHILQYFPYFTISFLYCTWINTPFMGPSDFFQSRLHYAQAKMIEMVGLFISFLKSYFACFCSSSCLLYCSLKGTVAGEIGTLLFKNMNPKSPQIQTTFHVWYEEKFSKWSLKGLSHESLGVSCYASFKSSLFKDWPPIIKWLKY